MDFAHFGLLSSVVFEGTMGVNERIYPVNRVKKKRRERNVRIKKSFLMVF